MQKPEVKSGRLHKAAGSNPKITREELAKQIRRMRDRDAELVVGIFKNLENPATAGGKGSVSFGYKIYPGDEYTFYELWDGERYTLPRGVARHLNNGCFYREYQQMPNELGNQGVRGAMPDGKLVTQSMQMSRKIHRYAFNSLEYMDDDMDMRPANLIEITTTP